MLRLILFFAAVIAPIAMAVDGEGASSVHRSWSIGDQQREATIYVPAKSQTPPPVIFVFHGHGGSMLFAARQFDFQHLWPQAVVVYPQGLLTKTTLDPEGTKLGWQRAVGDEGDRDLHFFDVMFQSIKEDYHIDPKRVYVCGHSNGGFFTYVLWAARGKELTAFAPVAAFLNPHDTQTLKPKPVLHVAGQNDPLVKFEYQDKMMTALRHIDHCDPDGKPAGEFCTQYTSIDGPTVITYIHPGGHEVPAGAAKRIVAFFKGEEGK